MCGIAGVIAAGAHPTPDLAALSTDMVSRLLHRGPDSGGTWSEGRVAMSHRRLSIVDLSEAGAQPMRSEGGRFVLCFNGEVYNHVEMRHALQAAGVQPDWRGHSDTETLLSAIVHWGLDETLRRAEGMFALALWDRTEGRMTLARDRMGEKPLYWGWADTALVFGSEIKALRAHPGFRPAICPDALGHYLALGYVPAPYSIHPGIYKLEPGCLLDVTIADCPTAPPSAPLRPGASHGGLSIRRYWSLDAVVAEGAASRITDPDEAIRTLEPTLSAAVGRQMVADVPLGAFLSGGIDSSLIVALMQGQSRRRVQTFTVGFESKAHDESPFAAAVARHLGTEHAAIFVTDAEARGTIPKLPEFYDEPFADSSQIPTFLVCQAARSAVTVALSGDAGDELFGGYNRHIHGPRLWRRLAAVPRPLRHGLAAAALAIPETAWNRAGALLNALRPPASGIAALGQKVHRLAARLGRVDSVDGLYLDTIKVWPSATLPLSPALRNRRPPPDLLPLQDPVPSALDKDAAGRMMLLDMRSYLPDDILCKVDRAAMATSLETRVPFLDPNVIALSARLPTGMKITGGQGKWPLRQILYKHVPKELIERPKTGFSVPLAEWLRGPLRGWAEDLLSPAALAEGDLLDPAPIRAAWADHLSATTDLSAQLWIILMFQSWRRTLPGLA